MQNGSFLGPVSPAPCMLEVSTAGTKLRPHPSCLLTPVCFHRTRSAEAEDRKAEKRKRKSGRKGGEDSDEEYR